MGKSNKKLLGVAMIVVALMVVVVGVVLLPMSESPAFNDPNKLNSIVCDVTVKNDVVAFPAEIVTYTCSAVSQCFFRTGFDTTPINGIKLTMGSSSKSLTFAQGSAFGSGIFRTDPITEQLSICVPSTLTSGVIKLFKDGNERDSINFELG